MAGDGGWGLAEPKATAGVAMIIHDRRTKDTIRRIESARTTVSMLALMLCTLWLLFGAVSTLELTASSNLEIDRDAAAALPALTALIQAGVIYLVSFFLITLLEWMANNLVLSDNILHHLDSGRSAPVTAEEDPPELIDH